MGEEKASHGIYTVFLGCETQQKGDADRSVASVTFQEATFNHVTLPLNTLRRLLPLRTCVHFRHRHRPAPASTPCPARQPRLRPLGPDGPLGVLPGHRGHTRRAERGQFNGGLFVTTWAGEAPGLGGHSAPSGLRAHRSGRWRYWAVETGSWARPSARGCGLGRRAKATGKAVA